MNTTAAAVSAVSRARAPFEAAVERARLTVVPHRRVRAPRMPFVTLVSVVLLGGIVGLLCFNTQMQQASFAATTLEERAANLSAREQTLQSELQALRDPQHVALLAAQAGMVAPLDACTLRLGGQAQEGSTCTPAARGNTPNPLSPAPPKPAVIDPPPQIVTVPAAADSRPARDKNPNHGQNQNQNLNDNHQARDTGRG
ncbi:hypothetical protein [Nocardioides dilutus]